MKLLHKLNPEEHNGNTHLSLKVEYHLGGANYNTCKKESRGIYLHITKMKISGDFPYQTRSFLLYGDGNCKVLIKELKRKSKKQIELFFKFLNENKEKFIEAALDSDRTKLFDLINQYKKES